MTHSHALDLEIVAAALSAERLGFVGLIGSPTKRARFSSQMRAAGLSRTASPALSCRSGPGVRGQGARGDRRHDGGAAPDRQRKAAGGGRGARGGASITPTRQRDDGNPSQLQRNPNFSERNPSRAEQIPNPTSKSSISFAKSSLFNNLRRPGSIFLFKPIPASRRCGRVGAAFLPGSLSVLRSSFPVPPASFKQVKGWRRLRSRRASL